MSGSEELKIVGWGSYDSDYPNINFKEYSQQLVNSLVIEEIRKNGYSFSGEDHQNYEYGAPIFSNGTILRCSMRVWGVFMAVSHGDVVNGQPNYMDYYVDCEEEKLPEEEAKIAPGEENDAMPVLIGPDVEMIMQSIATKIEIFTYDKAILEVYPFYKMRYSDEFEDDEDETDETPEGNEE